MVTANAPNDWEKYLLVQNSDSTYSFKTSRGYYISVRESGNGAAILQ